VNEKGQKIRQIFMISTSFSAYTTTHYLG